jgi:hypothetical protein
MSTEKRDSLATATVLILPAALQDIDTGLDAIDHGKVAEGVKQITDALARLKALISLSDEACTESRSE